MKKLSCLVLAVLLLVGCAAAETEHTHMYYVNDDFPVKSGWRIAQDGSLSYFVAKQGVCDCGDKELVNFRIPDEDVPEGGVQTCPHEVWVMDNLRAGDADWAREVAEDITGFRSAACMLCNEDYLFFEGDAAGLTCDGRTHIFQRKQEVLEEGWYPSTAVRGYSATHSYQTYYSAECVGCSKVLKCYISGKTEGGALNYENCDLQEVASYHRYETDSDSIRNEGNTHVTVYKCSKCGNVSAYEHPCNLYMNFLCSEEMKQAWEFYGLE